MEPLTKGPRARGRWFLGGFLSRLICTLKTRPHGFGRKASKEFGETTPLDRRLAILEGEELACWRVQTRAPRCQKVPGQDSGSLTP